MNVSLSRRSVLAAVAAAAAGTTATLTTAATAQSMGGWPYANHDPANTNRAPNATGPQENVRSEPLLSFDSDLSEGVIVADGTLYLGYGQNVGAYSLDGTEQWTWTADEERAGTPVAYADQSLFVKASGANPVLRIIDIETAAQESRVNADGETTVTPFGKRVYLLGTERLFSFNQSGSGQWQQPLDQPAIGTAVTEERVIVTTEGEIVALNRADGEVLWRQSVQPRQEPVVADGRIYVAGETLVAFDEGGTELWRASDLPATTTVPAATADTVYVGAGDDEADETFFAVNAESGAIEWGAQLGSTAIPETSAATTRPAATPEMVYVGSNQTMHGIDAESGEIRWRETVGGTVGPPVPIGAQLLFPTAENELLSVTEGPSTGSDGNDSDGNDSDGTDSEEDDGSEEQGETDDQSNSEASGDSDDGSGPGFGVPAGLSALGGVGYLLRRRLGGIETDSGEFGEEMDRRERERNGDK